MAETTTGTLADVMPGSVRPAQSAAPAREKQVDKLGRAYGTGKRKNAIARVWLKPGPGKIVVNGKEAAAYFARVTHQIMLAEPNVAVFVASPRASFMNGAIINLDGAQRKALLD